MALFISYLAVVNRDPVAPGKSETGVYSAGRTVSAALLDA
jgi:hypothetical protein